MATILVAIRNPDDLLWPKLHENNADPIRRGSDSRSVLWFMLIGVCRCDVILISGDIPICVMHSQDSDLSSVLILGIWNRVPHLLPKLSPTDAAAHLKADGSKLCRYKVRVSSKPELDSLRQRKSITIVPEAVHIACEIELLYVLC